MTRDVLCGIAVVVVCAVLFWALDMVDQAAHGEFPWDEGE